MYPIKGFFRLTIAQDKKLIKLAQKAKCSKAEIIRRLLDAN